MFKTLITTIIVIISLAPLYALADILVIGDSHLTGPFGDILHKSLAKTYPEKMIMVYAHSSSAPIHWMSKKPVKLTGGINHHMSFNDKYLSHPNLPHWRIPQNSQNLSAVLKDPVVHESWKLKIQKKPELRTIVIALGANDVDVVVNPAGYKRRVEILDKMLQEINEHDLQCIWIGPPSSLKSSQEKEELTYQYLIEGIKERCPFFDSRKFIAKYCDQVHFNCPQALPAANEWAGEVADFITRILRDE